MTRLAFALPLLAAVAACSADDRPFERSPRAADRLASALEGYAPSETKKCIPDTRFPDIEAIDEKAILFKQGRTIWLQTPDFGCARIGSPGYALVTESRTGQMCAGDTAKILDTATGMIAGTCAFGEFTKYEKAD
ncbi:hypothetical protein [Sphingomicrobium nitratireducens]|uniref:hypothetical protein n=1 Tax=Sphingomicrobium nitratireducens TaxID=2964666 RepID=UPI00223F9526|nr:hypothetical protein [Sphingomicrobium nitratireducens]